MSNSCLSFLKVKVAVSSLIRRAKRSQSRQNICTAAELVSYIRQRVSDFTGQRRKAWTENRVEGKVKKKLKTADINTLFYVKVNDTRLLFFFRRITLRSLKA